MIRLIVDSRHEGSIVTLSRPNRARWAMLLPVTATRHEHGAPIPYRYGRPARRLALLPGARRRGGLAGWHLARLLHSLAGAHLAASGFAVAVTV